MGDSVQWTQEQQNAFSSAYKKYESMPGYNKEKAYASLFSKQMPFGEAKGKLEALMHEASGRGSSGQGGLEKKASSHGHAEKTNAGQDNYQANLIKMAAGFAAAAVGLYAIF